MRNIKILDCTLRDGGYINNNSFGIENIRKIVSALEESNIDIIECGYIKDDKDSYLLDVTEYKSFEDYKEEQQIKEESDSMHTLMLLGEKYDINNLPRSNSIKNIIRMSFHKKNLKKAIQYAQTIQNNGYKLFLQPTVTINYTEKELKELLKACNEIKPFGVAIVDTFGQLTPKDVSGLTKKFDEELNKDIWLGFHPHNNLQNAYANAIEFINSSKEERTVVIDSSICGMGRGAGNLPTELLVDYLNKNYGKNYDISPLLEVSDNIIEKIKEKHNWGYSLPYYLSAINGCHPSYVISFLERHTLNATDINKLINMISEDKKIEFNQEYADELYRTYNNASINDDEARKKLQKRVENKNVILIGPGKSILKYQQKIEDRLNDKNTFSISVNSKGIFNTDAIFFSNKKRYEEQITTDNNLLLLTSNIKTKAKKNELIFDYEHSLAREKGISDSSVLMIISILKDLKPRKIIMAGFDGFTANEKEDFYSEKIEYLISKDFAEKLNIIIKENIDSYRKKIKIESLTPSKNIEEDIKS